MASNDRGSEQVSRLSEERHGFEKLHGEVRNPVDFPSAELLSLLSKPADREKL